MSWPGKAHVIVSIVHVARGAASRSDLPNVLDGKVVRAINDRLEPRAQRSAPVPLSANKGIAGLGVRIDGPGFLIPSTTVALPAHVRARRAGVLRPYLGAEELNEVGRSHPPEHVIDFHEQDEGSARRAWPDLFRVAEETVKPARVARGRLDDWWRFSIPRFYSSYGRSDREVLAAAIYTKHLIWSFVPGSVCLNSKVFVVDTSSRAASSSLERAGKQLHEARAKYMLDERVGLTVTYNRLKDRERMEPTTTALRRLHEDVDRAALGAYGWSTVEPPAYDAAGAAVEAFEDELLRRLCALNAERAAAQQRAAAPGRIVRGARAGRSAKGSKR